ncbi:DUF6948 domain-containing protein, partial [Enterococcus faecium]|uniref:DUF6948 domain-containing protein n=1 Tax=Enterococcus faecium TaxID=1352 RepID=UPI003F436682
LCTELRGLFFGYASDTRGENVDLKQARMGLRWGTTRGVGQLAKTGPTPNSNFSDEADMEVRKVTLVVEVGPEAAKAWEDYKK